MLLASASASNASIQIYAGLGRADGHRLVNTFPGPRSIKEFELKNRTKRVVSQLANWAREILDS